ncbi:M23 family metallopeptidase [Okibacterium fritillariae]|uniref:M23 family metallopeptidase n=1 Tax=Okibacterium fritillariae TaxID=123320 RepID=UPI0040553E11
MVEESAPARPLTRRELREQRLREQAEIVAAADAIDVHGSDDVPAEQGEPVTVSVEVSSAPELSDAAPATSTITIPAVHTSSDQHAAAQVAASASRVDASPAATGQSPRPAFTIPGAENVRPVASARLDSADRAAMPVPAAILPASTGGHSDLPGTSTRKGLRERLRSTRSTFAVALVIPGLVGTFALPAYALAPTATGTVDAIGQPITRTADGQSLTVAQTVAQADLARDTYDATSKADLSTAQRAAGFAFASGGALSDYTAPSETGWWRPAPGAITSPYGPRSLICNGVGCSNSFHEGIDFGGACGTPVKAASDGLVTFVGNAGAFGNRVIIKHNDTEETIYGHLLSGSFQVAVGDVVTGGQYIADIGATGVVSGCHLDLKVQINGEHTDPAVFLRSKGVTV